MNYAKRNVAASLLLTPFALLAALPEDDIRETRVVSGVFPVPNADKVVLQNESLDDWEVVSAGLSGMSMTKMEAYASIAIRSNGVYDVQFAEVTDFIKGMKLRFVQSGPDVVCRAVYARYADTHMNLGVDLDFFFRAAVSVAGSAVAWDYGIDTITFRKRTGVPTTVYQSAVALSGPLVVNAPVVVMPEASFGEAGRLPAEVVSSDRLDFMMTGGTEAMLTNRISGVGGCFCLKAVEGSHTDTIYSFGSWETTKQYIFEYKTLMLEGKRISDIHSFENVRVNDNEGTAYHFRMVDEKIARVQMQRDAGTYIFCALIELTEDNQGVWAKLVDMIFKFKSNGGYLGMDLEANHEEARGNYHLSAVDVVTRAERARVVLAGENVSYGGHFEVATNVDVVVQSTCALPTGGVVMVENGGCLSLEARASLNARYWIKQGGTMKLNRKDGVFGRNVHVDVTGGTLEIANGGSTFINDSSESYLNSLTVSDGVVCGDFKPMVGNTIYGGYEPATWLFTGSTPSFLKTGVLFVGCAGMVFNIDVDDVTGDDGVDLYQTGPIRDYMYDDASYASSTQYGHIHKRGAGTWRLEARCRNLYGDIFVDDGTLLLATNDMFPKLAKYYYTGTGAIKLNGGTLASESGITNTLLGVQLLNNSTIRVPEGGRLDIVSCAGIPWTTGMKLNIVDPSGRGVRFGVDATALTVAQQRQIRLNGSACRLNDEGYLEQTGMVLLLK